MCPLVRPWFSYRKRRTPWTSCVNSPQITLKMKMMRAAMMETEYYQVFGIALPILTVVRFGKLVTPLMRVKPTSIRLRST